MKIKHQYPNTRRWHKLHYCSFGTAVRFRRPFHQAVKDDDIFVVVDDRAYQLHDERGKVAVVNLATGRLSRVDRDREVRPVDAEVIDND